MEIKLEFDKTTSRLSGNPFGKKVYSEQVEKQYKDYTEQLILVFPDHIKNVASSFVQGFFTLLVAEIGYEGINEMVTIKAGNKRIAEKIMERIH